MTKVIYFNQWFTSITSIIEDIKEKLGDKVYIIASSKIKDHAYRSVVDKFIAEDWKEDNIEQNYVNFTLNVCKENHVDIFLVRKHADIISKHKEEFERLGVHLAVEDYNKIMLFNNKIATYNFCKNNQLENIVPEFIATREISDDSEAMTRVLDILNKSNMWCFKKAIDEGGISYRAIVKGKEVVIDGKIVGHSLIDEASLSTYRVNEVNSDEFINMVKIYGKKLMDKLIFMEVLNNPEVSVDCYNSKKGFIAMCRAKGHGRGERIYFDSDVYNICKKLNDIVDFKVPFNVQFRTKVNKEPEAENLRLLEVNTRMAGGTYYGLLFGANMCEVYVKDIMGIEDYDIERFKPNGKGIRVTHVEKAVMLEDN